MSVNRNMNCKIILVNFIQVNCKQETRRQEAKPTARASSGAKKVVRQVPPESVSKLIEALTDMIEIVPACLKDLQKSQETPFSKAEEVQLELFNFDRVANASVKAVKKTKTIRN
ncbi:hypothetical protein H6F77_16790 [Microcoleus sp. FACHB-831]|uniref:hypothetical protein n=1 Tax=Microcoleus sp. FACHB-831 TaxID=2692827 RepID=UPI0016889DED|nr:hypothetical protein [Microcoleus sp. FACHB-831]MBD1922715.1 hypothetical protein [Microcoleus sp. FACHB-831]